MAVLELLPKKDPREKKLDIVVVCPKLKNGDQNSEKTEKSSCW
jgi:hypothetical protein